MEEMMRYGEREVLGQKEIIRGRERCGLCNLLHTLGPIVAAVPFNLKSSCAHCILNVSKLCFFLFFILALVSLMLKT